MVVEFLVKKNAVNLDSGSNYLFLKDSAASFTKIGAPYYVVTQKKEDLDTAAAHLFPTQADAGVSPTPKTCPKFTVAVINGALTLGSSKSTTIFNCHAERDVTFLIQGWLNGRNFWDTRTDDDLHTHCVRVLCFFKHCCDSYGYCSNEHTCTPLHACFFTKA